jgi:hypothetical protein
MGDRLAAARILLATQAVQRAEEAEAPKPPPYWGIAPNWPLAASWSATVAASMTSSCP